MAVLDAGRIGIAAQGLGIAEAAYEASVPYAREREAFGTKIGEFQGIQFKIADMKTRIEAARLLTYTRPWPRNAARRRASGYTLEASMAKLFRIRDGHVCGAFGGSNPRRHGYFQRIADRTLTSATPRLPRFTKAPARSSGWSLRGRSWDCVSA